MWCRGGDGERYTGTLVNQSTATRYQGGHRNARIAADHNMMSPTNGNYSSLKNCTGMCIGSVTIDVRFALMAGFSGHFYLLITFIYGDNNSSILQFTTARTEYSRSAVSSHVSRYRLPTANVPFSLSSRAVPMPQLYKFLTHGELNWN